MANKGLFSMLAVLFIVLLLCSCNVEKNSSCSDERIAFVSNRDKNNEIYLINADGSGLTRLTNHSGNDMFPVWSPDKCRIAFMSDRDGNSEIYVLNVDKAIDSSLDEGILRLTDSSEQDGFPVWSPNGSQIAFIGGRNSELFVIDSDGNNLHQLTERAYVDDFCDMLEELGGYEKEECFEEFKDFRSGSLNPVWSPDGQKIAFISGPCTGDSICNYGVYVVNIDGSSLTRLSDNTEYYRLDGSPTWIEKDQVSFLCTGPELSYNTICTSNFDGNKWSLVEGNVKIEENLYGVKMIWSPNGDKAIFSTQETNYGSSPRDIYLVASDGSGAKNITISKSDDHNPIWLPNGLKIAFVSDRDGNKEIYVMNIDGMGLLRLTNNPSDDFVMSP
jgi:TolB protein